MFGFVAAPTSEASLWCQACSSPIVATRRGRESRGIQDQYSSGCERRYSFTRASSAWSVETSDSDLSQFIARDSENLSRRRAGGSQYAVSGRLNTTKIVCQMILRSSPSDQL